MTDITLSTSVAELVAAGHVKSLQQLKALLSKSKSSSSSIDEEVLEVGRKVLQAMKGASDTRRWRTGDLVGMLFGLFSGSGCETTEAERKMRHRQVSKALKHLSNEGQILKISGANAAHTRYRVNPDYVEPQVPDTQTSDPAETQTDDSPADDSQKVETVEPDTASKPKPRVRKKK